MDPFEIFSQFMASAAGHSHGHSHAGMIPEEEYEDEEEYDEDEDGYGEGAVACCGPGGCCGGDDEEELPFPPFLYQYFPVSKPFRVILHHFRWVPRNLILKPKFSVFEGRILRNN